MSAPTHEDAMVMLKLWQVANTHEMARANQFVWGDDTVLDYRAFLSKFPMASEQYGYVMTVLAWFETAATLWKHKLINETLLFDWILARPRWNRLEAFVRGLREATGEGRYFDNFEALAKAQP